MRRQLRNTRSGRFLPGQFASYSISLTNGSGATVSWQVVSVSGNSNATVSSNGTQCTVSATGYGKVTLYATIDNGCNSPGITYSKDIVVQPIPQNITVTFENIDATGCYLRARVSPYIDGVNYSWSASCSGCSFPAPNFPSGNAQTYDGGHSFTKTSGRTYYVSVNSGNACGSKFATAHRTITSVEASSAASFCHYGNGFKISKASAPGYSVYPNPADDRLLISFGGDNVSTATINLFDATGRVVLSQQNQILDSTPKQYNIALLPAGIYILSVTDNTGNTYHTRIVKK